MKLVLLAFAAAALIEIEARHLSKCELVYELKRHNFPANQLRNWVCLIQSESSGITDVVGPPNGDGSRDYGLFQINDRYWCSNTHTPRKICGVTCNQLLTPDISHSASCAKIIYQRHGFNAWHGWLKHCRDKPLPDINSC